MAAGDPGSENLPSDLTQLLPLALSRPQDALLAARSALSGQLSAYYASLAHHAIGIVLRDRGDLSAAITELRKGLRLARMSGKPEREADVQATLGAALAWTGRSQQGLAVLDRAVEASRGDPAGRVLMRRASVLYDMGRFHEAHEDLSRALPYLRRGGDTIWEARSLTIRAHVFLGLGLPGRAAADFARAEELFATSGQELEYAKARHNRGLAALIRADIPEALTYFDEAENRYNILGEINPDLAIDRCSVLLAAGLAGEAANEADTALSRIPPGGGTAYKAAELLFTAATAALAAGNPADARERADRACRLFRTQGRPLWAARAALVLAQARYAADDHSAALFRYAEEVAASLGASPDGEAMQAHLLAGRVALDLGRRADAESHLAAAARSRRRGPPLARASGWLAEALRAEAAGRPGQMLAACRRGLDVLDEHRCTLGASELRAQATVHGAELAALAQRHAASASRPRLLLAWSERWRAAALAVPEVRPPADAELNGSLAALRSVTRKLEEARSQEKPSALLRREQHRLERTVRASSLRARGAPRPEEVPFDTKDLLDRLGAAQLVEIIDIDGGLRVLICGAHKVRQFSAGRVSDAVRAADFARFALRRLGRSRPGDDPGSAQSILAAAGPRLQEALLGPATRYLGEGPVVIVPTGTLHPIPWTLLPALRNRVVSVAPSAGAWMRARTIPAPRHRRVILARGPGLASRGGEVPLIAPLYDDVTELTDGAATAEKVLYALDGTWLAHIAAHGTFRADSPLFSSLHMQDGPLTVYDFERLSRAPYRLILSSCDSGVLAPTGANELLGLVSSLLPLGTAEIIASIGPLNDHAVVPLMADLHRHVREGRTLAESVYHVRRGLADDPVQQATALSLLALGGG